MRLFPTLALATSLTLTMFGCFDPPLCISPSHCELGQACATFSNLEEGLPSDLIGVIGQCSDTCERDSQCREGERCGDDATCVRAASIAGCETADDCSLYGACVKLENPLPFLPSGLCDDECDSADECREGWACTDLGSFPTFSCVPVCNSNDGCRDDEECMYGLCLPAAEL